jgi:hypothetical protein
VPLFMHVLPTQTAYQDSSPLHSKSLRTPKILTFMLRPGLYNSAAILSADNSVDRALC